MELSEKYRIKSFLKKAQIVKGRRLTKRERIEVIDGYLAIKKLGIYDKSNFEVNRKSLDKHW